MKKFAYAALFALAAGMIAGPVVAAMDDDGEKKFTVHGEVRSRWTYLDNFADFTDTEDNTGDFDDQYSFLPYRARVSVHGQFTKNVEGVVEIQSFGTFGNEYPTKGYQIPTHQQFHDPNQVLGANGQTNTSGIDLYQAYVRMNEVGGSAFYIQLGRQEWVYGKELFFGDNDYYNGRTFDGLMFGWESDNWDIMASALTITERNAQWFSDCPEGSTFVPNACRDDNVNMYNVTATIQLGDFGDLDPYLVYYRDGAGTSGVNPTFIPGYKTLMLGARWGKDVGMDDDGLLNWNIEAAYQDGDIDTNGFDASQKAWITEGWLGFNFHGDDALSRITVGFLISSGDDDLTDNESNVLLPLFGDIHANNRLGNIDFGGEFALTGILGFLGGFNPGIDTGITDLNVRYDGIYGPHELLAALHWLEATDDTFLVDAGIMSTDIGVMLDLGYNYNYSSNLALGIELSTFQPGGIFEDAVPGGNEFEDPVYRVAAQARLRF